MTLDREILWRTEALDLRRGAWGEALLEPGQVLMEVKIANAAPLWLAEQFLLFVDDNDPLAETAGGDVVVHGHVSLRRQCPDLLTVSGCHARAEFDILFHDFLQS